METTHDEQNRNPLQIYIDTNIDKEFFILSNKKNAFFIIVERKGILVQIEKALISKGFQQDLKFTKDELEKEYFHRDGRFEALFQRSVKDIFVDWNFKDDKSMMAFILEK